jgi:ankyrin repeat protein
MATNEDFYNAVKADDNLLVNQMLVDKVTGKNNIDINWVNPVDKKTLLQVASENSKNDAIIKLLIKNGAKNEDKNTPLHLASKYNNSQLVTYLIKNGAKVDEVNKYGQTPLHLASHDGNNNIVNILIDNNATIDAKDNDDNTPLHYASADNHIDVVETLLKHGADINANNKDKLTPIMMTENEDIRTMIRNHGQEYAVPKIQAMLQSHKIYVNRGDESWKDLHDMIGKQGEHYGGKKRIKRKSRRNQSTRIKRKSRRNKSKRIKTTKKRR